MAQTPEYRRLVRLAAGYNRKAERLGLRGRVTADDLLFVERVHPNCRYCGVSLEPGHGSFDHATAMDKGGENLYTNIVRCCMTCQRSKWTKTPAEYEEHQQLTVECAVCGTVFKPRWAEYQRGKAVTCSRSCSGRKRWLSSTSERSTPAAAAPDGRQTMETLLSRMRRPTSNRT